MGSMVAGHPPSSVTCAARHLPAPGRNKTQKTARGFSGAVAAGVTDTPDKPANQPWRALKRRLVLLIT
jgi:hypothetical protein